MLVAELVRSFSFGSLDLVVKQLSAIVEALVVEVCEANGISGKVERNLHDEASGWILWSVRVKGYSPLPLMWYDNKRYVKGQEGVKALGFTFSGTGYASVNDDNTTVYVSSGNRQNEYRLDDPGSFAQFLGRLKDFTVDALDLPKRGIHVGKSGKFEVEDDCGRRKETERKVRARKIAARKLHAKPMRKRHRARRRQIALSVRVSAQLHRARPSRRS